jgi:thiamine pyrophosphate-dependent acetolactate synthase large subunit-like protein
MNGGEIVAAVLREHEVQFLFTLCGGHISPVLVEAKKSRIRIVDTRHEANAVFAADALARLTGKPGVAAVTAGPGITNTITAIHNAFVAQSPLVLLGGAAPTLLKGRGALQDIDQLKLIRPNVKWAGAVKKKKEIYPLLNLAFEKAQEGVPGPVFLELPVDILYDEALVRSWYVKGASSHASIQEKMISWYVKRHVNNMFSGNEISGEGRRHAYIPTHSTNQVRAVTSQIVKASKPVLVIGSGTMMQAHLAGALAKSVIQLNIPTYLSGMARGLLGAQHNILFRHHRKEALKEADLVILAGVPCDFRLDYGRQINRNAFVVGINRSKTDLNRNRKPDLGVQADPLDFLTNLASHLHKSIDCEEWIKYLRRRDSEREEKISNDAEQNGNSGINPVKLFTELSRQMISNHIIVADGGDFVGTASYILKPNAPLTWLDPGAFGTLGIGGGFALGAKLHSPESTVYIIYGDGSSAYSLMEMDTSMRHNLPVIAIIGNDASWQQIARDQIDILKDDCGTVLRHSHYEMVAHAFGARGKMVSSIDEFNTALAEAHASVKEGISYIINAVLSSTDFRKGSLSM